LLDGPGDLFFIYSSKGLWEAMMFSHNKAANRVWSASHSWHHAMYLSTSVNHIGCQLFLACHWHHCWAPSADPIVVPGSIRLN